MSRRHKKHALSLRCPGVVFQVQADFPLDAFCFLGREHRLCTFIELDTKRQRCCIPAPEREARIGKELTPSECNGVLGREIADGDRAVVGDAVRVYDEVAEVDGMAVFANGNLRKETFRWRSRIIVLGERAKPGKRQLVVAVGTAAASRGILPRTHLAGVREVLQPLLHAAKAWERLMPDTTQCKQLLRGQRTAIEGGEDVEIAVGQLGSGNFDWRDLGRIGKIDGVPFGGVS